MRYLKLLSAAALFFGLYACTNDEEPAFPTPYTGKMEMKVNFSALPDASAAFLPCAPQAAGFAIPEKGFVQGSANLIDEVNTTLSPYIIENCYLRSSNEIVEVISGTITSMKGDAFKYRGEMIVNFDRLTIGGDMTILEGSGRMEGASGTLRTSGSLDPDTGLVSWTGFGTIIFFDNR